MTIATKTWRLGPSKGRGESDVRHASDGGKLEAKLDAKQLAKSKASVAEIERMLARQIAVLSELRADGLITTEAEKSVARLEAALLAQRVAHDGLLAKAGTMDDRATEDGLVPN